MTDTVGAVFLAQTVGCARCHNHKFDKISQKEYFQLQSFFANTAEVNDHPARDQAPQELEYRKAQAKWEEATKDIRAQRTAILEPFRARGASNTRRNGISPTAASRSSSRRTSGRPGPLGQPPLGERHDRHRL